MAGGLWDAEAEADALRRKERRRWRDKFREAIRGVKLGVRGHSSFFVHFFFAAMALAGGSPFFVALVAVLGFFLYATRPVIQAWMLDATPKNMAGSSIGVLFGAQALGGAIGPLLGGMVADRLGLLATFYFLAFTIVIANLFVFGVKPSAAPRR